MKRRWIISLLLVSPVLGFVLLPPPEALFERAESLSVQITDREGRPLRELRGAEGRSLLIEGELPSRVRAAFVAAEDKRFDSHPGIDPLAIARAAVRNLRAGAIVSGASTITQQLARMLVPRSRSVIGKLGEALWALRLTLHLDRPRILREYLNRVPLGASTIGVEAASELYFGRPSATLSVSQAAMLAAMASAPARADPRRSPAEATRRMKEVLRRMRAAGYLDDRGYQEALGAPLDLIVLPQPFAAPHFVTQLAGSLPARGLASAVRVETTIDSELQREVEAIIEEELRGLVVKQVGHAAAIVVDNASGEVLAYVGSAGFFDDRHGGQNDGVRAERQPGSALKPFVYGLALSSGMTPATILSDLEMHLATPTGDYVPRNYDRRTRGPVRLRAALANSYNIPAVSLTDRLGPSRVLDVLRLAGFESLDRDAAHYGVGIVLGNGDVTLYELARAYRGLANGGFLRPLVEVREAFDQFGRSLPVRRELSSRRFLSRQAAALVTDILSDAGSRSPAFGLDNALRLPFPAAAKTGTSRAHVDNWTAGFTRERTVAVWVGNFDGQPMRRVSGITGAGPIWKRIIVRAMRGIEPGALVDRSGFDAADICPLSGLLAGPWCSGVVGEIFLPGSAPRERCSMHREIAGRPVLEIAPEFHAWAVEEGLEPVLGHGRGRAGAQLLLPHDGDEYLIDPAIPLEDQAIPLRVSVPAGVTAVEVASDQFARRVLSPPFEGSIPATRGVHRLALFMPGSLEPLAVVSFTVR